MTYRIHAEIVSHAVLPASAGRVSRFLAVSKHPVVDVFEAHGVILRFEQTSIQQLRIAWIGNLAVDVVVHVILLRDHVVVLQKAGGRLALLDVMRRVKGRFLMLRYHRRNKAARVRETNRVGVVVLVTDIVRQTVKPQGK